MMWLKGCDHVAMVQYGIFWFVVENIADVE
jgi:hypothetical protein